MRESPPTPPDVDIKDILKSTYLFGDLHEDIILTLTKGVDLIDVEKGQILIREGDPADCLYIVVSGYLQATTIEPATEKKRILRRIGPGDPAGEMALSAEGKRTADVYALSDATVLRIENESFAQAAKRAPYLLHRLSAVIRQRLRRTRLSEILPPLFGTLDEPTMSAIEAAMEWVHLPRGNALFKQGEIGDSLFILVSGRLQARAEEPCERSRLVGEISPGEPVGEMAIFTGEPRSASVYAIRDSILIQFTRSAFDRLICRHPELMRNVTRAIIERLRRMIKSPVSKPAIKTIALVYVNHGSVLEGFVDRLKEELSLFGPAMYLNADFIDRSLGTSGAAQISDDDPFAIRLSAWLDEQEMKHQYLLYEADADVTPWTRRCIRQADLVLLIAGADGSPELSVVEKSALAAVDNAVKAVQDLILVHTDSRSQPRGTHRWLSARHVRNHYHVRWAERADFQRLARILSGNAVGLVLGGGGARGFAHIGVLKALKEYDIPIDMVGGTSIGAIIAALIAMGWNAEAIQRGLWDSFVVENPFADYTLPVFALLKDRKFRSMATKAFKDTRIEDLLVNYFCVSSCLNSADMIVHRSGSLHQAVRASSALPGITPPIVMDGKLLVDGAVLDNLPGDVMHMMCSGPVIVVDVGSSEEFSVDFDTFPSPWEHVWNHLDPFRQPETVPTILNFLTLSTMLSSKQKAREVKAAADMYLRPPIDEFGLLDFKELERIVEVGYRSTLERIDEIRAVCIPQ